MVTTAAAPSTTQENIALGMALAGALVPVLGPNAALAYQVATSLMKAVMDSVNGGEDITDEQIDVLLEADAALVQIDLKAQADAKGRGDTSGT